MDIYVDETTKRFLQEKSKELGRTAEDLAACAVEEYCLGVMKRTNFPSKDDEKATP